MIESEAREQGIDIDVYVSNFKAMRHTLSGRDERTLMKLIVRQSDQRVLGCQMLGPDAGEIVQGLAVALKAGATKADFDATVGIHPTAAEEFVTMRSVTTVERKSAAHRPCTGWRGARPCGRDSCVGNEADRRRSYYIGK